MVTLEEQRERGASRWFGAYNRSLPIYPFTLQSPFLLPEHQTAIKHGKTGDWVFCLSSEALKYKVYEDHLNCIAFQSLRNVVTFKQLICFFIWFSGDPFKPVALKSLFLDDRRNQTDITFYRHIYPHILLVCWDLFNEFQSKRVFLYPVLKFSSFVPCYKSVLFFSFLIIFCNDFINVLMILRSWNNIATHS